MKRYAMGLGVVLVVIGLGGAAGPLLFSETGAILAKVGERVVLQEDLDELVKAYAPLRKGNAATPEDKKELLNRLVRNLLISGEAEKERLDEKPEVQRKLRIYRNELLAHEYLMTRIVPQVTVTDEEIRELVKKTPNPVSRGSLTVKEILVKTEKEAHEIYEELKKGADFSKLATERSLSQTKTKGGLIGPIPFAQVPPLFMEALSPLKEGEFIKPMRTDEGFWIFLLVNRKEVPPEQVKQLEEKVREKILEIEKNKRAEALLEKKVEELKKQTRVEVFLDLLK